MHYFDTQAPKNIKAIFHKRSKAEARHLDGERASFIHSRRIVAMLVLIMISK